MSAKKPVPERLRARLELRRSNAAVRHKNRRKAKSNPGHGDRGQQKRSEIHEQREA